LYAIKPMVIAVVIQAFWKLGRSAIKTRWLAVFGAAAVVLTVIGINELLVLLIGGVLSWAVKTNLRQLRHQNVLWTPFLVLFQRASSAPAVGAAVGLWPMFLLFAKIGSVLFGSGYVLLAFLHSDLVERYHWLNSSCWTL